MELVVGDLELCCAGTDWRERLDRAVADGTVLPEWCFALRDGDGERAAAVTYWAPTAGGEPVLAWRFHAGDEPSVGAELLRRTVSTIGSRRIMRDIELPVGQRPQDERSVEHEALTGGGFELELERLSLRWDAAAGLPPRGERLRFGSAKELGSDAMLDAIRRVAIGSLDHDSRMETEAGRAEQDAREAYEALSHSDWFEFGYLGDEPVGFVVPSIVGRYAMIEYIGVFPEHRGRGYVDDLLAHGTGVLAGAGRTEVDAGTDAGNVPMAAAFARAGYTETGRIFRYYWRR